MENLRRNRYKTGNNDVLSKRQDYKNFYLPYDILQNKSDFLK